MREHHMTQGWRAKRAAAFAFFAQNRSRRTEGQGDTLTEEGERLNHEGNNSQGFETSEEADHATWALLVRAGQSSFERC